MLRPIEHSTKFKDQVIHVFEDMSRDNPALYKFLYEACHHHSVFLVGGFLRSVANDEKPRDLDVMFNLSNDQLSSYICEKGLLTRRNKFGGFKIDFHEITLDVWASENNWAFMDKVVAVGHRDIISGVAHGTFLNYDSLVFDLRTEKINVNAYNECVRSRTLDIIRKNDLYSQKNPGKIGNVIRAFRIRQKTGLDFSVALCEYIIEQFHLLGIREKASAVDFLLDIIQRKPAAKNVSLQNKEILNRYLGYVIDTAAPHRKNKHQLNMFAEM